MAFEPYHFVMNNLTRFLEIVEPVLNDREEFNDWMATPYCRSEQEKAIGIEEKLEAIKRLTNEFLVKN